ncbi:hypothetical protein BC941DRAFT_416072 [Chlamydoabsidia padenii]|nr:hypothetical protein BC941DRAFT_416072 [Chlamydoabsidia padenii]
MLFQRCFHHSTKTLRTIPTLKGQMKLPADPTSTVYRGKLFEWQTLEAFESLGMTLVHVGGKSDGGIDLKGEWIVDNNKIPVIIQCKNVKNGCTPDHLRGLLGTVVGLARPTLSILTTSSCASNNKTYTPDTMTLFNSSTLPLGLARVSSEAVLDALVLNHAAQRWIDIQIHPRFDSFGKAVSPPLIITGTGHIQHTIGDH